jgi:hypothetical protein
MNKLSKVQFRASKYEESQTCISTFTVLTYYFTRIHEINLKLIEYVTVIFIHDR